MALVNTGLTLASLRSEFFDAYKATGTIYQDLTTRLQSTTDVERYGFLGTVPPLREWGQGRMARGLYSERYDVANLKYESTLEVSRDEISDDQTGQIRVRIKELGARAATHPDSLLSSLLVNGHSTGFNSYDGVPYFSATHASGKSGTQNNNITSIAVNINAPTLNEIRTAIKAAIAKLMSLLDDQGEPMNNSATGLTVVCPPLTFIDFADVLAATVYTEATEGQYTSNALRGAAKVTAFSRLTAASVFYLLKTDVGVRPFIFQDREPVEFVALEGQSDDGFNREVYKYGVRARYRVTYGYWQHAVKVTFSVS